MQVLEAPESVQQTTLSWRQQGMTVGLVPTMGFLHEGHLSLIRLAREQAEKVILSLFVNPTQFAPNEDLDCYPSAVEKDLVLCEKEGVDVVFLPNADVMYASDASITVQENLLSRGLCGSSRPTHFTGVLTVVAKLFNICLPDLAVFGEKDAQQIRLIRRMVRDLNFPVEIVSGPIVREVDGVAMSSRNTNLSPEARAQAPMILESLSAIQQRVKEGEAEVLRLKQSALDVLSEASLGELDYLEIVDNETLEPLAQIRDRPALAAIAVRFPGARLIDNVVIS